jgi:hypothetical protein
MLDGIAKVILYLPKKVDVPVFTQFGEIEI